MANKEIMLEDARIIFRNFSGKEDKYNREGDMSFGLVLPPDLAEQMLADGWNVKYLPVRDEGDEPTPHVNVVVSFKNRPPKIFIMTSTTRTQLNADTVAMLDFADIQTLDVIITGYDWEVQDKSGTKAYLQSLFVTIREDALERKYKINEPMHKASDG